MKGIKKQRKGQSCNVSEIPKDHMGLYLAILNNHSRQSHIKEYIASLRRK